MWDIIKYGHIHIPTCVMTAYSYDHSVISLLIALDTFDEVVKILTNQNKATETKTKLENKAKYLYLTLLNTPHLSLPHAFREHCRRYQIRRNMVNVTVCKCQYYRLHLC